MYHHSQTNNTAHSLQEYGANAAEPSNYPQQNNESSTIIPAQQIYLSSKSRKRKFNATTEASSSSNQCPLEKYYYAGNEISLPTTTPQNLEPSSEKVDTNCRFKAKAARISLLKKPHSTLHRFFDYGGHNKSNESYVNSALMLARQIQLESPCCQLKPSSNPTSFPSILIAKHKKAIIKLDRGTRRRYFNSQLASATEAIQLQLIQSPLFTISHNHDPITVFSDFGDISQINDTAYRTKYNPAYPSFHLMMDWLRHFNTSYAPDMTPYRLYWMQTLRALEISHNIGASEKRLTSMFEKKQKKAKRRNKITSFPLASSEDLVRKQPNMNDRRNVFKDLNQNFFIYMPTSSFLHHFASIDTYDIMGPAVQNKGAKDSNIAYRDNPTRAYRGLLVYNQYIPTLNYGLATGQLLRDVRKKLLSIEKSSTDSLTLGTKFLLFKLNAAVPTLMSCFMAQNSSGDLRLYTTSACFNTYTKKIDNTTQLMMGIGGMALTCLCTMGQIIQRRRSDDNGKYHIVDIQEPNAINPLEKLIYVGLRKNIDYFAYGIMEKKPIR